MSPFLVAGQLGEPALSPAEGLTPGPLINESIRPWGRPAGVGLKDQGEVPAVSSFRKLFNSL